MGTVQPYQFLIAVRDVTLHVRVIGRGYPLLLMHGGPGADHSTLLPLLPLAGAFTLVYYDHRCNGRSTGAATTMTWENLTADAEALRQALGFERWAVLGHSFGGMVALEYALRYPRSLSHLLLVDTCGDTRWVQERAPEVLAQRGYSPATVEMARRFYNGRIAPRELVPAMLRLGSAYYDRPGPLLLAREALAGLRIRRRPEAFIYAFSQLLQGWTAMERLSEIVAPTLVLAGRQDFQFPPEHQATLAAGIPGARLQLVEHAGHDAPTQRPAEVMWAVREFLGSSNPRGGNH